MEKLTLRNAETKKAYKTDTGFVIAIIKKITNDPDQRMRAIPDAKSIVGVKIRRLTDQVDMEVDPEMLVTQLTGDELQAELDKYEQEHPTIEEGDSTMTTAKGSKRKGKNKSKGADDEAVTKNDVTYDPDAAPAEETTASGKPAKTVREKKEKAPAADKVKKETLADVINPMLQAKKYTAGQIADAVIAKFPDREYPSNVKDPKQYLISVITTVRLKYAQEKFGAANVGLVEDKTEAKPAKEKKAKK